LTDGESPSVILNFLSDYDNDTIIDIMANSYCVPRMLTLGFLTKCTISQSLWLLDVLKQSSKCSLSYMMLKTVMYFLWQILKSNRFHGDVRNKTVELIKTLGGMYRRTEGIDIRHPHNGVMGKKMERFDMLFVEHIEDESGVIEALCSMDVFDFSTYTKDMQRSLWFPRMMQLDVFESLDIQRQYIFIQNLCNPSVYRADVEILYRFFLHILGSNTNVYIKNVIFDVVNKVGYFPPIEREKRKLLEEVVGSGTYPEMIMTLTLYGMDELAEKVIMYFVSAGNKEVLMEMYENNIEMLKENLDITDLIEYWKENGKRWR